MAKKFEIGQKRVVGFLGHSGSGKTSICEAILFNTGENERLGSVDAELSLMDFEPEEQKRRYSVSSSFYDVKYKDHQIFLIDTPGNSNFIPDAISVLPAIGAAVIPVDAVEGVKYQTELICEKIKEMKLPHAAFITKLDKEHSNFETALESIKDNFSVEPVLIQLPIGAEDDFKGVVDLLANKAYTYDADGGGKAEAGDIPAEMAEKVKEIRKGMIELLVEGDDDVMMKYLDGEEVSDEDLQMCLKKGMLNLQFCPVLCGASTRNIAIDLLQDLFVDVFPNPAEERERTVLDPSTEEESTISISEDGPFAAQVIKTLSDPFAGRVSIMRVYRGKLTSEDQFYDVQKGRKEKPGKIFHQRGKKQETVDEAVAGDIVAVLKLKDVKTEETLCAVDSAKIRFPDIPTMKPMIHMAVLPKSQGEEEKMSGSIQRVLEEDINLLFWREDQTKQFILSGIGQSQLDVALERMKRKFGTEVALSEPKVPYRETIKGKAEVQGKYKKQSGGRGQYGDCHIRVEPLPRGSGYEFVDKIVGGVIPRQFIPAVNKGIKEAMIDGELTKNPVQDVRVELFFGSFHTVDSSEIAFKSAGRMAWRKAMLEAEPIILEPIFKVFVTVPTDFMGDVYGNISSRRGKVQGSGDKGKNTVIESEIPQSEMHTLGADLRAMTGDRGYFEAAFDHYQEAPTAIAEKIIEEVKKEKEEN